MNAFEKTIAVSLVGLLVGCAQTGGPGGGGGGPAVAAPSLKVGDRWTYHGTDGYRVPVKWEETHEVVAASPQGITVLVTGTGGVEFRRTEQWSAPGVVTVGAVYEYETSRFDPALIRYQFPLTPGQVWTQELRNLDKPPNPLGAIRRHVSVDGYESVTTPAGTFNAIKMRILMQMDDATFYRYATQCNYVVWYAPEVGAMVREEQRSYYRQKGGLEGATVPGQHAVIELSSFARGGG